EAVPPIFLDRVIQKRERVAVIEQAESGSKHGAVAERRPRQSQSRRQIESRARQSVRQMLPVRAQPALNRESGRWLPAVLCPKADRYGCQIRVRVSKGLQEYVWRPTREMLQSWKNEDSSETIGQARVEMHQVRACTETKLVMARRER